MNKDKTEPITEEELKQNVLKFLCLDREAAEQRKKDYLANKKKVIRVKKKS